MKSERARAFLDRKCPKKVHPISGKETYGLLSRYDAERAIDLVEEEAEEALQKLHEKYAADVKRLLEIWDTSDQKNDRLWLKESEAYKADIKKYKRKIFELKQRLAIAEKVIADKNKESRK